MELERAKVVDENFKKSIATGVFPNAQSTTTPMEVGLSQDQFLQLFQAQCESRHLDIVARVLKEKQQGFYTIGSSGHEGNAAIALVFRTTDMAFLHYRSGAFMLMRAKAHVNIDMVQDILLSMVASKSCPISGGRHKVFGSLALNVPPQTSTIASQCPKALGTAIAISTAKKLQFKGKLLSDSVVLCSFGDASFNHSTAQGAFNASAWVGEKMPLPLVWICEDNQIGISVPTPKHWIADNMAHQQGIAYIPCDGLNLSDVYRAALQAQHRARIEKQCAFIHMKTIRLLAHAGSDIESRYRTEQEIIRNEQDDPLLHTARDLHTYFQVPLQTILDIYNRIGQEVNQKSRVAVAAPKLVSAPEVMASIIPPKLNKALPPLPELEIPSTPRTMAQSINLVLTETLKRFDNSVLFGEDVGKMGGVYNVTNGLQAQFGAARVFDTLLDEQTILGTAIGFAHNGFIPIPEIQFLAYLHNAIDQLRGEAATLPYFSNGQYTNPMVIRIPAFAYQKGFGGHFHNDNAFAFLREIPGLIIACPSNASDAVKLFRTMFELAYKEQRIGVFLEPIALYHLKDLYNTQDGLAQHLYPLVEERIAFGELGIDGDLQSNHIIISYGNGMMLARRAAHILKEQHQLHTKLIDLRWLAPLNKTAILEAVAASKTILIVDESRHTGSISEQLMALFLEGLSPLPKIVRITAQDSFIPLGDAQQCVLPSRDEIVTNMLKLAEQK